MKSTKLFVAGLLAIAGVATANAQAVGDLILGFTASGGMGADQNVEVDLGSVGSILASPNGAFNFGSLNLNADLTATYGANWATRSDLSWGVVGGSPKAPATAITLNGTKYSSVIWASAPTSTPGASTPYLNGTRTSQNPGLTDIIGLSFSGAPVGAAANTWIVPIASNTSWNVEATSAGSFGFLSANVNGNLSSADLYQIVPTDELLTGGYAARGVSLLNSSEIGFALGSNGSFTYGAIPEPSMYAMILGVAALGFVMLRRRQQSLA